MYVCIYMCVYMYIHLYMYTYIQYICLYLYIFFGGGCTVYIRILLTFYYGKLPSGSCIYLEGVQQPVWSTVGAYWKYWTVFNGFFGFFCWNKEKDSLPLFFAPFTALCTGSLIDASEPLLICISYLPQASCVWPTSATACENWPSTTTC